MSQAQTLKRIFSNTCTKAQRKQRELLRKRQLRILKRLNDRIQE